MAKNAHVYSGRAKKSVDALLFNHTAEEYISREITAAEAEKRIKINEVTFSEDFALKIYKSNQ